MGIQTMKSKWILISILAIAFILRVVGLNNYPTGFTPDEASFGYDAYSLIHTGKDQWGLSFPLVFKSFGDYKAPVYTYLTIPSVAMFGLNKFSVRLPNALVGVGAVYVLYLLVSQLSLNNSRQTGLVAGLLLAVSPWHIMMSRGAFEANLITFFLPLGIYLFLKDKYYWSMVILGLNMFTYHSAKLITPLIIVMLFIFFREKFSKQIIKPLVVFGLFLVLTIFTVTQGSAARIAERSITQGALEDGAKTKIELIKNGMNPILARALHNKYQVVANRFITNYKQYFSLKFLITSGPAETTYGMMKGLGVLSYLEIFGILSFIYFWKNYKSNKAIYFLIAWLLIAPIPASLATGVGYSANRAESMIPVIQVIASIGIYYFLISVNKSKIILSTIFLLGLSLFLQKYIYQSPKLLADGMLEGNLEKAKKYIEISEKSEEVVVPRTLSEPHIYIAFVGKIDPTFYQSQSKNWDLEGSKVNWVDQLPEYKLGKFTFKNVEKE
jgi:4-amino-4-deoxy-L-arabinose transferase-like glycosyltransferase